MNPSEKKFIEDLNYCIKMISSKKLFDMSSFTKKNSMGINKDKAELVKVFSK